MGVSNRKFDGIWLVLLVNIGIYNCNGFLIYSCLNVFGLFLGFWFCFEGCIIGLFNDM